MTKDLKFDFYRVMMPPEEATPFETILQNVSQLQGQERTFDNGDYHVRLLSLAQRPGYFLGDVARIRMNDIPDKMRLTGEREMIELDEDQGLGEITSFIYNPALNVIAFMRNRFAVTPSGFANYFQSLGHIQGVMYLQHILESDAYRKLARMTIAHKVEVAFAAPGNAAIYENLGLRPQTMMNLMDAAPKVKMDFTFSMEGQRNLSLPLNSVRTMVSNLQRQFADNVTKLQVSGKENPEQRLELVDMLEDIMTEKEPITIRGNQRAITDEQRHYAIERAYIRKLPELSRIFRDD